MTEELYEVVQVEDFVFVLQTLKETNKALTEAIERIIELEKKVG